MTNYTNSPAAYGILNPHPRLTRFNDEGHIVTLVRTARKGYTDLAFYRGLAAEGAITIHSETADEIQTAYGWTSLAYTIN